MKTDGKTNSFYNISECKNSNDLMLKLELNYYQIDLIKRLIAIDGNGNKNDNSFIDSVINESKDIDDISINANLSFASGNIIKSIFGIAKFTIDGCTRHEGTNYERDHNKLAHYIGVKNRELKMKNISKIICEKIREKKP